METSTSLLDRLRERPDEESWRRLDGIYRPLVLRWLLRDPSLQSDADELAQEILLVVHRELPGFERRRAGSFRKWLRTITAFRVSGHYRERRKTAGQAGEEALAGLADDRSDLSRQWDREHNEHVVRGLLDLIAGQFPDAWVRAFTRSALGGAPTAEVAGELGVTPNVVLLARSRILKRLREIGKGLLD